MKHFVKKNISEIPIVDIHEGSVSRQVITDPKEVKTPYLEAYNKGFIKPGNRLEWTRHRDIDEITIVIKGQGKYSFEDKQTTYKTGDIIIVHANVLHKIEAEGNETSEFYWLRIKTK